MQLFLYTSNNCPACPNTKIEMEKVAKTNNLLLKTKKIEAMQGTEVEKLNLRTVPTLDIVDEVKGSVKRLTGVDLGSVSDYVRR